ncbi:EF-hand domain-containing protein [Jannaschia ovalis]|uniref:EF-hand domain-containing protein n=1 Tax=Jannaschia ovalis TaxID=3038773 RepID=A0ABY8LA91_9RHOB|nr:hypothetical protein [Jannaschia sp. GRR-S6-38]WGH78264.1 hypothetical protein P8627_14720 [Jannaschia sp. GRR-S6-38]
MKTPARLTAAAIAMMLAAPASAQMVMMSYDVDGDGQLTGAEYRNLFNDNFTVARFDTDNDGMLSMEEYEAAFGPVTARLAEVNPEVETNFDINADGMIDEEELAEGVLSIYDADDSGFIDGDEFTVLTTDYDGYFQRSE